MNRGRYRKHSRDDVDKVDKLRKQGLEWSVITQRMGLSESTCRRMLRHGK